MSLSDIFPWVLPLLFLPYIIYKWFEWHKSQPPGEAKATYKEIVYALVVVLIVVYLIVQFFYGGISRYE